MLTNTHVLRQLTRLPHQKFGHIVWITETFGRVIAVIHTTLTFTFHKHDVASFKRRTVFQKSMNWCQPCYWHFWKRSRCCLWVWSCSMLQMTACMDSASFPCDDEERLWHITWNQNTLQMFNGTICGWCLLHPRSPLTSNCANHLNGVELPLDTLTKQV